jgi:hypothetical protein
MDGSSLAQARLSPPTLSPLMPTPPAPRSEAVTPGTVSAAVSGDGLLDLKVKRQCD